MLFKNDIMAALSHFPRAWQPQDGKGWGTVQSKKCRASIPEQPCPAQNPLPRPLQARAGLYLVASSLSTFPVAPALFLSSAAPAHWLFVPRIVLHICTVHFLISWGPHQFQFSWSQDFVLVPAATLELTGLGILQALKKIYWINTWHLWTKFSIRECCNCDKKTVNMKSALLVIYCMSGTLWRTLYHLSLIAMRYILK